MERGDLFRTASGEKLHMSPWRESPHGPVVSSAGRWRAMLLRSSIPHVNSSRRDDGSHSQSQQSGRCLSIGALKPVLVFRAQSSNFGPKKPEDPVQPKNGQNEGVLNEKLTTFWTGQISEKFGPVFRALALDRFQGHSGRTKNRSPPCGFGDRVASLLSLCGCLSRTLAAISGGAETMPHHTKTHHTVRNGC